MEDHQFRQLLEQDLIREYPGSPFEIIFLRNNLLAYYQDELKRLNSFPSSLPRFFQKSIRKGMKS